MWAVWADAAGYNFMKSQLPIYWHMQKPRDNAMIVYASFCAIISLSHETQHYYFRQCFIISLWAFKCISISIQYILIISYQFRIIDRRRKIYYIFYFIFSGDGDYKPYVSSDPDITTVEMNGSEDFMIIACDGLWDTVTPMSATICVYNQLQTDKGQ